MTRVHARALPRLLVVTTAAALAMAGCSLGGDPSTVTLTTSTPATSGSTTSAAPSAASPTTTNVYAANAPGMFAPEAALARPLVYVPNSVDNSVQVIDPKTFTIIDTFKVGKEPQHVVPGWDLKTLWVNADQGNTLTPIDPRTGAHGAPIDVPDPYNLYFTPDGSSALVMAERLRRIDVRDPHTFKLKRSLNVPCRGVNHADYTADFSTFVASCEFSGKLLVIPSTFDKVARVIDVDAIKTPGQPDPGMVHSMGGPRVNTDPGVTSMPQDVRLTPDGRWFLSADMLRNGVWVVDAKTMTVNRFIPTGKGAHGIYPSRDATRIFVSNRDEGTVSVLDATTLKQVALWKIPGGGSPDMGDVSADGSQLWLSGRYSNAVYVFDTTTGALLHRIKVRAGPHGLVVWPQPGRFSLGHTGNMR